LFGWLCLVGWLVGWLLRRYRESVVSVC
jgi:hypothetical protein